MSEFPRAAAALVEYDSSRALTVTERASRRDARDGVLVDIPRDRQALTFLVARSEPGSTTIETKVTPRVFFRGRVADLVHAVPVSLLPAGDPVSITIRQSYQNLEFKDFADQFKEHPGQGYLHYGTNLQYKLILKADMPVRAVVRYGLTGAPQVVHGKDRRARPGSRPSEIHGVVKMEDFLDRPCRREAFDPAAEPGSRREQGPCERTAPWARPGTLSG